MLPGARSLACCLRTPLLLLLLWMSLAAALWPQIAVAAIQNLRVGDQVLALAEWKAPGEAKNHEGKRLDARLSYEKVLDIVTSHREQTLVHLSLSNGDQLTATEGHPFKTTDGWRDAVLLKKGGKLLLRAQGDEPPGVRVADSDGAFPERVATITEIRIERLTVPVYNLELANAHTFYVGAVGALVHNGLVYCRTAPGKNRNRNRIVKTKAKTRKVIRGKRQCPTSITTTHLQINSYHSHSQFSFHTTSQSLQAAK